MFQMCKNTIHQDIEDNQKNWQGLALGVSAASWLHDIKQNFHQWVLLENVPQLSRFYATFVLNLHSVTRPLEFFKNEHLIFKYNSKIQIVYFNLIFKVRNFIRIR